MDFYSRFTDRFRGSQQDIKARLEVYLPLIEPIQARYPESLVIDLGSGRGEWLELLQACGWQGRGVDTNHAMADACRQRGLEVYSGDALEGLAASEDASVIAVTGFHIAEHLPFDTLLALIKEAYRVLKPGGVLILETPNPENLSVGLWSFYMDPTHRHPLPPPLLHFVAEDCGFERADVLRLNGPEAPSDDARLSEQFGWALSAHPDYALIAHKRPDTQSAAWFDYLERLGSRHQGGLAHFAAQLERHQADGQRQAEALERASTECERLSADRQALEDQLAALLNSRSWRITAPLRQLMHWRSVANMALAGRLRRLAQIPWLKRLALRVLDRVPGLKLRVLKRMAHGQPGHAARRYTRADDFIDLEPARLASVREESHAQRDRHASWPVLNAAIGGLRVEGHFDGSYSLAAVNRHLVLRLLADADELALTLAPHEGQPQSRIRQVPGGPEQQAMLNAHLESRAFMAVEPSRRVALYHHFPLIETPDPRHGTPVALFFWEESWVPDDMIATLNGHYAGVVVTAWYVKKVLLDSGCRIPVEVVALPLLPNPLADDSRPDDLARVAESGRLNLLHVSSAFPRKGVDVLLAAFGRLASRLQGVELTLKTFPNPHNQVEALIEQHIAPEHRPRVHLIMDDYDAQQMAALFQAADIVVLPTRGEGLNMPAIEAGEFSRPLVVTGHGAHTDFADAQDVWWIPFAFDHAQTHFANATSVWSEPSIDALSEHLHTLGQALLDADQATLTRVAGFHQRVAERFHTLAASASLLSALARLKAHAARAVSAAAAPRIALYTTWAEACGIAEYSAHLVESLSQQGARLTLQVPETSPAATQASGIEVHHAWHRGDAPGLNPAGDHDILWLQHHFAFYPLSAALGSAVSHQRRQGKRVYITLHTSRPLLDFDTSRRRVAARTLAAFDRVFVHTLDDLNNLKRLGISDNVTLMLQGVAGAEQARSAEHRPDTPLTIGSFGFLLPHKGIHTLIHAFADLHHAKRLPADTRLRLVTALRDEPSARQELARCQRTARECGIEALVDWHTDFQPLDEVKALLAGCRLLVLPYQFTQESSSAAVRTAIAACPDVATTPAPIFDEVRNTSWAIDGFTAADIADSIDTIINQRDPDTAASHYRHRQQWLKAHCWDNVAARYLALFQAALADRDAWPAEPLKERQAASAISP